jgi:hypothetical protein
MEKFTPKFKKRLEVKQEALKAIRSGKSNIKSTLKTRYRYLNIAMGKGFSFKKIVLIAGPSGHGKSKILNDFLKDFNDPKINYNLGVSDTNAQPFTIITIHFCFEMLPADEILREESSNLGVSYSNLLGLEFNGETKKYNTVPSETIDSLEEKYKIDDNPNYYYFENTCTVPQLYSCVKSVIVDYKNREGLDDNFTDEQGITHRPKFIVALDHSLLLDAVGKEDVLSMMSTLGKMAIRFKKMGFLTIIVGQFNGNIESLERIKNPNLHFPIKSDIYAQAQLYNACDTVMSTYMPELIGLTSYTTDNYLVSNVLNLSVIKNRGLNIGQLWFHTEFEKGRMINIPQEQMKKRG